MNRNFVHYAQIAALLVVVVGCFKVLEPFIPALLFSAVVCASSWPVYQRLLKAMGGRASWAALMMILLWVVLLIGPSTLLAFSLADSVTAGLDATKELLDHGPLLPPDWLKTIPLIGQPLDVYWNKLAGSREELANLLKNLIEPTKNLIVGAGKAVGGSLVQLTLAAFIGYFLYRDGSALIGLTRRILNRIAGNLGSEILQTVDNTVAGVVQGIFGTALAQALVAMLGFVIAGVPGVLALGTATFLLSMVPIGPPLIWGGAAIWLFYHGSIGWAIFMVIWGLVVISSIDNFVKPYLISRSSSLPMLLIVFGVFGGILAFGFIGVFIGAPMLAIGVRLLELLTAPPSPRPAPVAPAREPASTTTS